MWKYLKTAKYIQPLFTNKIYLQQYYRFCQVKNTHTPSSTKQKQDYKLLFVSGNYAAGDIKRSFDFLAYVPTFMMYGYSSYNGWSLGNSLLFGGFICFGVIYNLFSYTLKSNVVHCVQSDKNLENIYLVMRKTSIIEILNQMKLNCIVCNQQRYALAKNYHPYKDKLSQIILQDLKGPIQQIKNEQVLKLQKDIIRLKIPRNKIKFILILDEKIRKQLEQDKLQLNQKQLVEKYTKYRILAIIGLGEIENNESITSINGDILNKLKLPKFLIIQSNNLNKQGNYQLTSLALGLKDNTSIITNATTTHQNYLQNNDKNDQLNK